MNQEMQLVDHFTTRRFERIASLFVDAWEESGAITAGAIAKELLGGQALENLAETGAALRPYIQAEFERRGWEFPEDEPEAG